LLDEGSVDGQNRRGGTESAGDAARRIQAFETDDAGFAVKRSKIDAETGGFPDWDRARAGTDYTAEVGRLDFESDRDLIAKISNCRYDVEGVGTLGD
jgi:hypothetical protein